MVSRCKVCFSRENSIRYTYMCKNNVASNYNYKDYEDVDQRFHELHEDNRYYTRLQQWLTPSFFFQFSNKFYVRKKIADVRSMSEAAETGSETGWLKRGTKNLRSSCSPTTWDKCARLQISYTQRHRDTLLPMYVGFFFTLEARANEVYDTYMAYELLARIIFLYQPQRSVEAFSSHF